jgi:hypothetical protein
MGPGHRDGLPAAAEEMSMTELAARTPLHLPELHTFEEAGITYAVDAAGTLAEAIGPPQPVAPTTTVPRRRTPVPVDPHQGHGGGGEIRPESPEPPGPPRASGLALPAGVELHAVRAGSCASAQPWR